MKVRTYKIGHRRHLMASSSIRYLVFELGVQLLRVAGFIRAKVPDLIVRTVVTIPSLAVSPSGVP